MQEGAGPREDAPAEEAPSRLHPDGRLREVALLVEEADYLFALYRWIILTGEVPRAQDWLRREEWPHPDYVIDVFGSWEKFLQHAEIPSSPLLVPQICLFAFLARASGLPIEPGRLAHALRARYDIGWAVITMGGHGAIADGPDGPAHVPSPPVQLSDTIGAGDTFMAGLLDALAQRELPLPEALRRAAQSAALVCEREGADPPTAAQLDNALHR